MITTKSCSTIPTSQVKMLSMYCIPPKSPGGYSSLVVHNITWGQCSVIRYTLVSLVATSPLWSLNTREQLDMAIEVNLNYDRIEHHNMEWINITILYKLNCSISGNFVGSIFIACTPDINPFQVQWTPEPIILAATERIVSGGHSTPSYMTNHVTWSHLLNLPLGYQTSFQFAKEGPSVCTDIYRAPRYV